MEVQLNIYPYFMYPHKKLILYSSIEYIYTNQKKMK